MSAVSPDITADCPNSSERGPWFRLGGVLLAVVCSLAVVVLASRALPSPPKRRFDSRPLRVVRRVRPEFVILGNSMAGTRMHARTLDQLLSPKRAVTLTIGGSRMPVWYLLLKNSVIAAGVRPQRVLIFYRYTELTEAELRESGLDRRQIDSATPSRDPIVEARLTPPPRHPVRRLARELSSMVPVERLREQLGEPATDFADFWVTRLEAIPKQTLHERINVPFALPELRASRVQATDEHVPNFNAAVGQSLLPDLIDLAKQHQIPLAFIRIRPQAVANGTPESPEMQRYTADARRWLEARGATLVDMSSATWETPELYRTGDHIAGRYLRTYTQMFVRHLPGLFQ